MESSCQRRLLAVMSASSCGASTVPRTFTNPFAVPPRPGRALSRFGASMVASRSRSFTPSSPLISAVLRRVLIRPSSFDGQSGTSLAVLIPVSFSSPRQLIACCQSSSAVSSVFPSSAATVSLSRLTCNSLPFASRVISAGGTPCPFTAVRNDSV